MKSIICFVLITWCRYSFVITWKEITKRVLGWSIMFACIVSKFVAILAAIIIIGFLLAVYGALVLTIGSFMRLFQVVFPDSLFFYRKKMPDDFRRELLEFNLET